jgi:AcrR family transcriptional regulator
MSSEQGAARGRNDKPAGGGKRERTRRALVAAALEVIAAKGFAAASLDEIAARAGMTKGAVYSNFSSKAELLLAAMGAKGLALSDPRPPAETVDDEVAAMATQLVDLVRRAKGEETFLAEFNLYALSDLKFARASAPPMPTVLTTRQATWLGSGARRCLPGVWRWPCNAWRSASWCSRS